MPNLNEVSIDFVTGTVTKIIFHNKEKEFGIFAFKIKDKSIKYKKSSIIAKGSILDLEEGAQLKLYGEVEVHSSYGEQFKVHHYEPAALINATADGFLNFLSGKEFKGIGKKIAEEIISIYGKENFVQDILENPEKLNDIHHLSEDTKQNLLEVLSDYHQKNNTLPEILRYVSSVKLAEKIIKKYEEAALEQVKNHPYSLIHSISGIGFHKADEIAALAGIKRDSEERIIAGLLYNLDFMSDETGNTLIRKEEFFKKTTELLAEKVGKEEVKNIKKLIKPCYKELKDKEYGEDTKTNFMFDMKGRKILLLSARQIPGMFKEFLDKTDMTLTEVDYIIPHQASRALPVVMEKLGVAKNQYIDIVKDYGNMVSVSVPFGLAYSLEHNLVKEGDVVYLLGTAAGMTVNMLALKL